MRHIYIAPLFVSVFKCKSIKENNKRNEYKIKKHVYKKLVNLALYCVYR
jgi:hypothetical protein